MPDFSRNNGSEIAVRIVNARTALLERLLTRRRPLTATELADWCERLAAEIPANAGATAGVLLEAFAERLRRDVEVLHEQRTLAETDCARLTAHIAGILPDARASFRERYERHAPSAVAPRESETLSQPLIADLIGAIRELVDRDVVHEVTLAPGAVIVTVEPPPPATYELEVVRDREGKISGVRRTSGGGQ